MKDKVSLDEADMQVYLEAAVSHWSETLKVCGDEEATLVESLEVYEEVEEEGRHVCGLRVTMWDGAVFNFRITRERESNRRLRKQVTCCDNTTFEGCLTVGRTYEVEVEEMELGDMQMYYLLDDNGEPMNTLSWRFAASGKVVNSEEEVRV